MPVPRFCPNPRCPHHRHPAAGWLVRYGFYHTRAHGSIQRYRCHTCLHTASDQTASLHYYAKRRLPLKALWLSLLAGSSLREIAGRYHCSPPCLQNALLRLGRQAMAAQSHLLASLSARQELVYDGLRSYLTSQDYPCDITTVVSTQGEVVLAMTHSISRRGGRMKPAQRRRLEAKLRVWRPERGGFSRDLSLLHRELWAYLRPKGLHPAVIHTDEHPLYGRSLRADAAGSHFLRCGLLEHRCTPSTAPRTTANPLFPVNYVDRLLRHRLKEHTRESIAFGREATLQMHRGWIFAWDHNARRPYRVRHPERGSHAEQVEVDRRWLKELEREFFSRRMRVSAEGLPESMRRVWMAELAGPPLRWRTGQRGSSIRVPAYARRDLTAPYQQGA